jgi:hypothetical protein
VNSFVPDGWKILKVAVGDLDSDCAKDAACVIEFKDSIWEYNHCQDHSDSTFQKPRILIILLKDSKSNKYHLSLQHNTFIMRAGQNGFQGNPLAGFAIIKNTLSINFLGNGIDKWNYDYSFKFLKGQWVLVEAMTGLYYHMFASVEEERYNFLENKLCVISGNNVSKPKETIKWIQLNLKELIRLDSLKYVGCAKIVDKYYL